MNATLSCNSCGHVWHVHNEPRHLAPLACPQCQAAALPQAAEDLASALEDVLSQLYQISQTHQLQVQLSTADIPPEFMPDPAQR